MVMHWRRVTLVLYHTDLALCAIRFITLLQAEALAAQQALALANQKLELDKKAVQEDVALAARTAEAREALVAAEKEAEAQSRDDIDRSRERLSQLERAASKAAEEEAEHKRAELAATRKLAQLEEAARKAAETQAAQKTAEVEAAKRAMEEQASPFSL